MKPRRICACAAAGLLLSGLAAGCASAGFTAAGHRAVTVTAGSSGAFSVPLPPGRYQVAGRSPDIMEVDGGHSRELPCSQPTSVAVSAGTTTTITLACIVP